MGTGKERIRRWRERHKIEGRKSVTIVISKKAYNVLSAGKDKTGENYGAIVERALLNMKRHASLTSNVTSNVIVPTATVTTKKLVDEGDYPPELSYSRIRDGGIVVDGDEMLNKGFLTRLLKTSRRKIFKR